MPKQQLFWCANVMSRKNKTFSALSCNTDKKKTGGTRHWAKTFMVFFTK